MTNRLLCWNSLSPVVYKITFPSAMWRIQGYELNGDTAVPPIQDQANHLIVRVTLKHKILQISCQNAPKFAWRTGRPAGGAP